MQLIKISCASIFFYCLSAHGANQDLLSVFFNELDNMQAMFSQVSLDETGEILEKTTGHLYLQRPDKIYWSYQQPYTQNIISDGQTLWIYDADLEQVTIQAMADVIDKTPIGIILGRHDISSYFQQIDMGNIEGYDWIELIPTDSGMQYTSIRFGFKNSRLAMIIIADNLGQVTRIDLNATVINAELPPGLFTFDIPDGVDVIDNRSSLPID